MKKLEFSASFGSMTQYIEQNADILVQTVVGASQLAPFVTFVPNLANGYIREIPYIDTTWDLKGGTCSTYANGGTFSHEPIKLEGKIIVFEQDLCLESMRNYFYGPYAAQNIQDNTIPFEAAFLNHGLLKVGKRINELFWQGGTVDGGTIGSIITKAGTAGATGLTAASFAVSTAYNNGIIATFDNMVNSLSGDLLGETDLTLYVGTKEMLAYAQSLRNVDNYHLDPRTVSTEGTFLYAHPNVRIVPQIGLSGQGRALLAKSSHIFYGADVNPESKAFETYYDWYTRKNLYRYVGVFGSAVAPSGSGALVRATSGNSF